MIYLRGRCCRVDDEDARYQPLVHVPHRDNLHTPFPLVAADVRNIALVASDPPKKSVGAFLQYSFSLMPCLQDSHLALYAWQQFLYFSQPPVDGFFLQYSSSVKPATQERHLALFA